MVEVVARYIRLFRAERRRTPAPVPAGATLPRSSISSLSLVLTTLNFDLDSEVPLVRRPGRPMYDSVHSGRQAAGPAMRSVCVHEDKGLRGHRVADILTTTITIGLTNPLVALRVKLTLSSQSDLRHSVSPRSGARQVTETLTNSTVHLPYQMLGQACSPCSRCCLRFNARRRLASIA